MLSEGSPEEVKDLEKEGLGNCIEGLRVIGLGLVVKSNDIFQEVRSADQTGDESKDVPEEDAGDRSHEGEHLCERCRGDRPAV